MECTYIHIDIYKATLKFHLTTPRPLNSIRIPPYLHKSLKLVFTNVHFHCRFCFLDKCSSSLSEITSLFSSVWLSRTSCFRLAVAISAACFFLHFVRRFWNHTCGKTFQTLLKCRFDGIYEKICHRKINTALT